MDVQPATIGELLNLAGRLQRFELGIREFHSHCWYPFLQLLLVWKGTSENTSKKGGCTRTPVNAYEHANRIKVKPVKAL